MSDGTAAITLALERGIIGLDGLDGLAQHWVPRVGSIAAIHQ